MRYLQFSFLYEVHKTEVNKILFFLPQLTHKINRLAYGDFFPGVVNPLDGYFFCKFPTSI